MGRTAIPCTFEDLVDAGIGTSQLATPRLEGEDIIAEVVTEYAGREIGRERQSLKGALLREALASLILSGSLFSGVGENLTRAIDAWLLHCALNPNVQTSETTALTPQAWLVSQLTTLGVEAAEEWQLLSAEDLTFTEIDPDTIDKIEAQYPKEFSINGAKFDVKYSPAQKLVTLRWQRGIRQPALSAVLLPRWNNWKVQLDLRGQVRTIRP